MFAGVSLCDGLLSGRLWPHIKPLLCRTLASARPATLQRQPVPASRTHELLMHAAGWLRVCAAVAGEGRGSVSDRCRASVGYIMLVSFRLQRFDTGS